MKGCSGRWLRERSRKTRIKFSNKQGKEKLFGYFVGQIMQETKGRANPEVLNALIKSKLSQ
ncbi:gatB domain protein [Anaplasma phagocytophilum str. ApNP]|uniref:GatB domain protein n=1 Tax=Anaplasma phagocytophilum str. ApNP TaxID=1359153 RepID=A0A0F3NIH5_ANAPH|nr:gatB domain protein [Anaplasma phagocytophilum str. ApNP]